MFKSKNIILALVFLIGANTANISFAYDNNNKQYMQIYHQQQLERAAREKAQYNANHYSSGSRRGLADLVGGDDDGYVLKNNEMSDEEYERFQRENRW